MDDTVKRAMAAAFGPGVEPPFARVLDQMPESIMLFDVDGHLVYRNDAAATMHEAIEAMVGYRTGDTARQALDQAGGPAESDDSPLSRVLRGERVFDELLEMPRADADLPCYVRCSGQWIRSADGRPHVALIVARDVTREIEARHALQARAREMRSAHERISLAQTLAQGGIWEWDLKDGSFRWTPQMFQLYGLDPATATASFETWRAAVLPEDLPAAEAVLHQAMRSRTRFVTEHRTRRPDGDVRWIRWRGAGMHRSGGPPVRMLGMATDVTDQKRLSAAAAEASAGNTARNMFLATIGHELRTPLNSIIGFSELLLEGVAGPLTPEQAHQLAIVKQSGELLFDRVRDILDIARIDTGEFEVMITATPLRQFLADQVEAVRPIAVSRRLQVEPVECAEDVVVLADRRRLGRVLRNLLSNALKFTDQGTIRVRARQAEGRVTIDVTDTGIGISPDDLAGLFTPFRQGAHATNASRGGAGLGLAIARSYVEAMDGSIAVESEPGQGTTFRVDLPSGAIATVA